jgi:pimeloyl-ACP methyl ester carboxylesterase
VIVPDMPGYGYSAHPAGPPLDSIAVAGLWAELMTLLGYQRFGPAGGDIGSDVSRYLALDHPDRVVAVHRTDVGLPVFSGDPADLVPEERTWLETAAAWAATSSRASPGTRSSPTLRCHPVSRCFPATSSGRRGRGSSAPRTSCA